MPRVLAGAVGKLEGTSAPSIGMRGEIMCSTSWAELRHDLRRAVKDRSGASLDAAEIADCTISCYWPTLRAPACVGLLFLFSPCRTRNNAFKAGIASKLWKSRPTRYWKQDNRLVPDFTCRGDFTPQSTSPENHFWTQLPISPTPDQTNRTRTRNCRPAASYQISPRHNL